ncbi:MAG: hypothetical protein JNG89_08345 [Planctomycetaceae bacterium]|nr:hypothetical protein [Planctomycetaceae bacterium]
MSQDSDAQPPCGLPHPAATKPQTGFLTTTAMISQRADVHRSKVLVPHPGPERTAIALDNREIGSMRRPDLIDLIRASRMTAGEVHDLGDGELRRLALLVRRCCRNQIDSIRCQRGQPLLWAEAI